MHGIKVQMAKSYIDNLSEEIKKGMLEKAEQSIYPSCAPLGYQNVMGPNGKRIIEPHPTQAPNRQTDVRVVCDGPMLNRRSCEASSRSWFTLAAHRPGNVKIERT